MVPSLKTLQTSQGFHGEATARTGFSLRDHSPPRTYEPTRKICKTIGAADLRDDSPRKIWETIGLQVPQDLHDYRSRKICETLARSTRPQMLQGFRWETTGYARSARPQVSQCFQCETTGLAGLSVPHHWSRKICETCGLAEVSQRDHRSRRAQVSWIFTARLRISFIVRH